MKEQKSLVREEKKVGGSSETVYKQLSGIMTPFVVPPMFLQNDCAFLFK